MPASLLLIIIGVIFVTSVLVAIIFLLPGGEKAKRKQKKTAEPQIVNKDWPLMVGRLEKHTETLSKEIEELERELRLKEKELAVEKLKLSQLQDKLAQEKSWREKEQSSIEKRSQEAHQFKQESVKAERSLEEEHAIRLRQERELNEAKREVESLSESKRMMSAKLLQFENSLDQHMKELVELRRTNAQLKKKSDDTTFIARSEYDKLEKLFKEKEKELARIKREATSE